MSTNIYDKNTGTLTPSAGVPIDTITALNSKIATNSDEYSDSKAYKVGDYCIHDNTVYRCKTACTANTWANNSVNFEVSSLTTAVTNLNSDLTELSTTLSYKTKTTVVSKVTLSANTDYVCSNDGYFKIGLVSNATNSYAYGNIGGADVLLVTVMPGDSITGVSIAYVNKGTTIKFYGQGGIYGEFFPLVS